MMNGWREIRLGDVAKFIDYRGKTPRKTESGIPLITAKIVKNGSILPPNEFIAEGDYDAWMTRGLPKTGDVVLTTEAPLGEVAQLKDAHVALAQRIIVLRAKEDVLDNTFLKYFLLSAEGQARLKSRESGTTVTGIKSSELQEVLVPIPALSTQKRIAQILSSLDDKIEVNNRINRNLEEQAKAIFRSWFVDFEPFQDSEFVDSELGLIPDGWRVATMNEITTEQRKKVGAQSMKVFSAVNTGELKLSEEYFNKQVFSKDIGKYIVVEPFAFAYNPARINIGSIGMNEMGYQGCVSPVYVVFSTEKDYHYFMNFLIKRPFFREEIKTRSSGSVRQSLCYKDFGLIKTVYPPHDVIEPFNKAYGPILVTIKHNQIESANLRETRDTLLPKLMSGEIKV